MTNLIDYIVAAGYIGITLVIFAETGLLVGFFLPGDSLLFTLGLFASRGHFSITLLFVLTFVAAVAGDSFGYWLGKRFGPKVFAREESFFFKQSHVEKTTNFFAKHGERTIILGRFIPIVRTFGPVLAGVAQMPYGCFAAYNVIGALLWVGSMLGAGFILGETVPNIDQYVFPIILFIIVVSLLPAIVTYAQERRGPRV